MSSQTPRFTCRDLGMRASEYLDGELQDPQRRLFEEHQEQCPACRGLVASLRRTIAGIRSLSFDAVPSRVKHLLDEAMQRARSHRS
ncbi:MAG TPA: zf-HC2 domain-containing protein [Candidatus Polarisedimenticolia bacterium]|jgi:anti-sigma factor RsiW